AKKCMDKLFFYDDVTTYPILLLEMLLSEEFCAKLYGFGDTQKNLFFSARRGKLFLRCGRKFSHVAEKTAPNVSSKSLSGGKRGTA
ncbi:MAG: hypothetical protein J6U31_05065, partial [Bacteroidales bacterium]|nr:hypothetical protein [Bacteroidales bacterium]